ncbi:hypothetical protein LJC61_01735 [Ruminococcaceae bacterium OttesenSCG-928-A16]|nr:hypothetical protein [Ruminococcaceae bacterium OttesenSCG-928-A16]
MTLQILPAPFSVCQLADAGQVNWNAPYVFATKTEEEVSLVCPPSLCQQAQLPAATAGAPLK